MTPLRNLKRLLAFSVGAFLLMDLRAADSDLTYSDPVPFSFDTLVDNARMLAKSEYQTPEIPEEDLVHAIDYLQHGRIRFKQEDDLWLGPNKQFAVSFFHVGRFFRVPVRMNVVEKGQAREMFAGPNAFEIPSDSPAAQMKGQRRIAGFKIQEDKNGKLDWRSNDWLAFLGVSYFRSIGELYQYGLSARGIAVNTANPNPPFNEEFPMFTSFWFESPTDPSTSVTIYALMEGPSVTGAFRFDVSRQKAVIMNVQAKIFVRKSIARLGLAPLTSMFWYSETARLPITDWRPEVHDSDGLAIEKSNGEFIWRPLNNPPRLAISAFIDENPKGFGLLQRDRNFHNYLEDGAYERRPSLWVDIDGNWGKGAVQLVELPTDAEDEDNIVAFWVPEQPAEPGAEFDLKYRLTWAAEEPNHPNLARCVATRLVREPQKRWPENQQRFIVEFQGGPLADLKAGELPQIDVWSSKGKIFGNSIQPLPAAGKNWYRVQFTLEDFPKDQPTELRLTLQKDGKQISETWLYQFFPEFVGSK